MPAWHSPRLADIIVICLIRYMIISCFAFLRSRSRTRRSESGRRIPRRPCTRCDQPAFVKNHGEMKTGSVCDYRFRG